MILSYAFCNVSVLPVRKEPSHRSEQVNQLLFGEKAEILEVNGSDWALIRGAWDGFEGWCKVSQLSVIERKDYRKATKFLSAKHSNKIVFDDSELWLPLGSDHIKSKITIRGNVGKFKGKKLDVNKLSFTGETIKEAAFSYINAPYQWGGRTIAGIDCSGLTQMAFKLCNRVISRDSADQANEGVTLDFLQHAQCGDLAFFDNTEGKIVHVGILLDNQTIIHATDTSGRVVVDRIDQGGIISTSLKKRTHNLRLVKRFLIN